ncbi:hypothetical protein JCM11491_004888, partial [Sporobolomyces phaffii]
MQHVFQSPPFDYESPASISMIRKRTFQDMQPGVTSSPGYSTSTGSPSSLPFHDYHFLSSPDTSISPLASSPMSRNASTQSCFSTFSPNHEYDFDGSPHSSIYAPFPSFSPSQQNFLSPDSKNRPGMKRRKTMPEIDHLSPTSHVKRRDSTSPRGGGKDGEDVWPPAVEECFQTALRLLPRLGRKKLIIQGKPCGRNELIADYIFRHTGKMRSRKQVSSHIQVLKNMKKDDDEFMYLVSDPVEGEDDFLPGNADLFFGKEGMASRHAPPVFLERSLSASNIPHHPPIDLSTKVTVHGLAPPIAPPPPHSNMAQIDSNALHSPFVLQPSPSATTPTSGLTRAMEGMSVAVSAGSTPITVPAACPIAPSFMSVVAPTSTGGNGHIYARVDARDGPTRTVFVEDLPMWEKRYGAIPAMNDHLPCQFLHVQLPLSIPGVNGTLLDLPLETQVRVTSVQALPLTAVTSIYCHGDSVITYEDVLSPQVLDASSTSLPHRFFYDVPFGSEFWTMLLRGGQDGFSEPTLRKTNKERQSLADMLPGFSVIQEFVVPAENGRQLGGGSDVAGLSPGSAMGDVVLVVLYDLEVSKGVKAQTGDLSFLSLRRTARGPSPSPSHPLLPSLDEYELIDPYSHLAELPHLIIPTEEYFHVLDNDSSSLDTARPPSVSLAHKPNLSLHIPPPPKFGNHLDPSLHAHGANSSAQPSPSLNGPITPWGQVVHTPTHPPPVLPPPSAVADAQRDRSRLEAAWRSTAKETNNRWDLDSPALYAPPPVPPPAHSSYFGLYSDLGSHDGLDLHHETDAPVAASNSRGLLSSLAMDRRSLSTPVLSMTRPAPSIASKNLLPPLPSPSSLATNFALASTSYSPSPIAFPTETLDDGSGIPAPASKLTSEKEEKEEKPSETKKAIASQSEQDAFFSNLLGSTT